MPTFKVNILRSKTIRKAPLKWGFFYNSSFCIKHDLKTRQLFFTLSTILFFIKNKNFQNNSSKRVLPYF